MTVKKIESGWSKKFKGQVVSPETPRTQSGLYWGYQVRYADSFRKVLNGTFPVTTFEHFEHTANVTTTLTESCFGERYDLKIGIDPTNKLNVEKLRTLDSNTKRPKRVLVVYGGLSGIEAAIEADERLKASKMQDVFDLVCHTDRPQFGSRSMRIEVD